MKKRLSDHTGLYTYSSEPSHLVPTSVLISADHVRHYVMLSETVILEKIPVEKYYWTEIRVFSLVK